MKKLFVLLLLVLVLFINAGAAAAPVGEPQELPVVSGEIFLKKPGGVPMAVGFDTEHNLDTSVPPGSYIYFLIDNATLSSHLAGYSAYARLTEGDGYADTVPVIKYAEMFDENAVSIGYKYAAQLHIFEGDYQEPHKITGFIRVGSRNIRQNEFKFSAVIQRGPLDTEISYVNCEPDIGLYSFLHEYAYTELAFTENGADVAGFYLRTGAQRPLNLSFSTAVDQRLQSDYPEGDFKMLTFRSGPVFDNMGVMRIYAPQSYYIYQITPKGLRSITHLYDEKSGCFIFNTRVLGTYLLSSLSLPEEAIISLKANPFT